MTSIAELLDTFAANPFREGTENHAKYAAVARSELLAVVNDLERDAARFRYIANMARASSLDISGNHTWTMQLRNIKGPSLSEAIDNAMKEA